MIRLSLLPPENENVNVTEPHNFRTQQFLYHALDTSGAEYVCSGHSHTTATASVALALADGPEFLVNFL